MTLSAVIINTPLSFVQPFRLYAYPLCRRMAELLPSMVIKERGNRQSIVPIPVTCFIYIISYLSKLPDKVTNYSHYYCYLELCLLVTGLLALLFCIYRARYPLWIETLKPHRNALL